MIKNSSKKPTVFLTGATGLVGSYLLKILLQQGHKVFCLARSKNRKDAESRIVSALKFWDNDLKESELRRCKVFEGELTLSNFGANSRAELNEIISETEIIYHSAALTNLNAPLEVLRAINVTGTKNILDFADKCICKGTLRKLNHISTAYVVGKKSNIEFTEDMFDLGQSFNNGYEQTKYEAEALVRRFAKVPTAILRPSMVMGETKTGKSPDFRLFYTPLHFFNEEIFNRFPADPACKQNLINADTVAKAAYLLGTRSENATYHIASPNLTSVEYFMEIASEFFGFQYPTFVPEEDFDLASLTPSQKALASSYIPYFNYRTVFGLERTLKVLSEYDFVFPEIDKSNLIKIFSYCQEVGYIKRRV